MCQLSEELPAEVLLRHWDARARRFSSRCGTGEMVWRVWGEGPPLVLFHGGAGAWSHWIRNLPVLVEDHTVIAPDLPGLGESASPPSPYTPESIADIIATGIDECLDAFCAGASTPVFDLCGFSFGGMICGLTAERIASRVGRVVLLGASGLGGSFNALAPVYKLPKEASREELDELHRKNLALMMIHDPEAIDELALTIQRVNAPRTRVMSPEHALTDKLERALRKLNRPVHSVWGEHCIFSNDLPRRRALLADISPGGAFHVVGNAGHWVQFEQAARVNVLLREILGSKGA